MKIVLTLFFTFKASLTNYYQITFLMYKDTEYFDLKKKIVGLKIWVITGKLTFISAVPWLFIFI